MSVPEITVSFNQTPRSLFSQHSSPTDCAAHQTKSQNAACRCLLASQLQIPRLNHLKRVTPARPWIELSYGRIGHGETEILFLLVPLATARDMRHSRQLQSTGLI